MLIGVMIAFGLTLSAQNYPSMKGYWYSPTTQEMLVISIDPKDNLILGRGVLYSNGNGRFKEMQIMTQTPKKGKDNADVYFLKYYDPKKSSKVWDVTSISQNGVIVLAVTVTGSRDKTYYFYNLKDMKQ